jgi:hypothetical protein
VFWARAMALHDNTVSTIVHIHTTVGESCFLTGISFR